LEAVVRARRSRGWTQEPAAEACSRCVSQFQFLEAGSPNTTVLTLSLLVEGLGIRWIEFAPSARTAEPDAPTPPAEKARPRRR
jgi:hypothetical protein